MRQRSWAVYVWYALATLEALMMIAALVDGQDPYRHQVLMLLALLFAYVNVIEKRL